jgi:hypothetical protein
MAMMCLALLGSLLLALASLSATEPHIGANHLRTSQARALADSGVEYALWALSNPAHPAGLLLTLPAATAPPPFDGRTFIALGAGGFTVAVTSDADPQRRTIRATGWTPTNSTTDARPKAHRKITVAVAAIPELAARAPCAVCVRGALTLAGNVAVDGANQDPACGGDTKHGTFTMGATTVTAPATITGGAGADAQDQAAADFEPVTLSPAALEALRTLAWHSGTYFGPGYPRGGKVSDGSSTWSGRVVFDAANPVPDGVVFVDTTDGGAVEAGSDRVASLATARLERGALAGLDRPFRGWIVVNGSLEITAGLEIRGLVYAVDGVTYQAAEAGRFEGLVISHNVREGSASRLEATAGGALSVRFDCGHARAADRVPYGFAPIPGTWREESD